MFLNQAAFKWASHVRWSEMQQLQFSISWLQITEVSFTSVIETKHFVLSLLYWYQKSFCVIFYPSPHYSNSLLLIFGKFYNPPPPPRFFKPLDYRYSRVISNPYSFLKVIYLAAIKNAIILIIYLYIKCMSANCLSISRPLNNYQKNLSSAVPKNIFLENFLQIIMSLF